MSSKTANPRWTRDEVILGVDLYMRGGRKQLSSDAPEVQELSALLRALPIHAGRTSASFRNPTGVSMKLGNFLYLDPQYEGVGLTAASQMDKQVWDEFADDEARLRRTAEAIRTHHGSELAQASTVAEDEVDEAGYAEGALLTRVHRSRERNSSVVRRKKSQVMKATGRLACEVCGFDFAETYGSIGEGFAECHHTKPLATLEPGEKTRLSDLAIVCANCHRMLHKKGLSSLEELRGNVVEGPYNVSPRDESEQR